MVEIEPDLVAWHRAHLQHLTGDALADPRVHIVVADLQDHLRDSPDSYDVICLDIDNGPDWTVTESNAALYTADGITRSVAALHSGGVLAVWSANPSEPFQERLADQLEDVRAVEVDGPRRPRRAGRRLRRPQARSRPHVIVRQAEAALRMSRRSSGGRAKSRLSSAETTSSTSA